MIPGRTLLQAIGVGLLAAMPAQAQVAVPVRSGEHESFTRLVFPAPDGVDWQITADSTGATSIRFDATDLRFDLSKVFDRIPRARLATISSDGSALLLTLGCLCDIDVAQIASDHVVIDIKDEIGRVATDPQVAAETPLPKAVLPLQLPPVATLVTGFRLPQQDQESAGQTTSEPAPAIQTSSDQPASRPQITIREHSRTGLLPSPDIQDGTHTTRLPACELEARAADLLLRNPATAVSQLVPLQAAVIDEAGADSPAGFQALSETYLTLGWGAEALQTLALSHDAETEALAQMAKALDGDPDLANSPLDADPACGPATTTLLLIAGQFEGNWGSVDEMGFIRFIDRLPDARRQDLERRLRDGLSRLGQEDLLTRLVPLPAPPMPYAPPTPEILAAGTDSAAVRSTIALLEVADAGENTAAIYLQNAIALLPSIPDGPLRDEFEEVLTRRLLLSGHVAEATDVVRDRPALAGGLLTVALEHLAAADLVEVAIRLRPFVRSDAPEIKPVAAVMRSFGLTTTAREFEAIRAGEGLAAPPTRWRLPDPQGNSRLGMPRDDRAWLERDFSLLSQAGDRPNATIRQQAAREVQRRNSAAPAPDDFAEARAALERSRRISNIMERLLADSK